MSFAQINYSQKVGTGPYTIAEVGCFITSFCNLLERFGNPIDPPGLNDFFLQHNAYTHDGSEAAGTADNVYWNTVSVYDGAIATSSINGPGWPNSNDAIVEFHYRSYSHPTLPNGAPNMINHFCLVVDAANGVILDSYDGVVKHSPYGAPVASATYIRHAPQVVAPPPPAEAPAFTIEEVPERTEQLKVDTHLWDLNQRTWPGLVNNPVGSGSAGTEFKVTKIAHHLLGGAYYLPDGSTTQGYNIVDCQDAPPAPIEAPTLAPAPQTFTENIVDGITFTALDGAPKQMWITRITGAEKWTFKDVTNWRGFRSVQHLDYGTEIFISGKAHHPVPPSGADYYMTSDDFGDFKKTGKVANYCGFNWSDISDKRPPAVAPAPPAPVVAPPVVPVVTPPPAQVETPVVASTAPVEWQQQFRPFVKPVRYIATRDLTVKDLSGSQPDMPLKHYDAGASDSQGVVSAFGTVTKDGINYYRLKTNNDPNFVYWYCVPQLDPVTRTPNLLVKPQPVTLPPNKLSVVRDTLELGFAHLEDNIPFLDDMIPKWLKNKK